MDMSNGTMSSDTGSMMMMMQMYFYASAEATILIKPWMTKTWAEMLGSCFGVAVFAILYEGMKAFRTWLVAYARTRTASVVAPADYSHSESNSDHDDQPITVAVASPPRWSNKTLSILFHALQSCLHVVQVGMGYLLMLISMTFNAYLFISIVLGSGIGYFIFNYKRPIIVDANEHCH